MDKETAATASWGQRVEFGCHSWAEYGYGAPLTIYAAYLVKIVFFIAGWFFFCSLSPDFHRASNFIDWAFTKPRSPKRFFGACCLKDSVWDAQAVR